VGLRATAFAEGVDLPALHEVWDGERHYASWYDV